VDELFRISAISQQVRYPPSAIVQRRGGKPEYIQVLLEGAFETWNGEDHKEVLHPPAMLGFQEVLEGTAIPREARAPVESIALVMAAEEFRELLSANIELALGFFCMLLDRQEHGRGPSLTKTPNLVEAPALSEPLKTVDKVLYLQTVPILHRATADELYELAAITREVELEASGLLFSEGHPASIWLLLSGAFVLESPSGDDETMVVAGDCLGVEETLAASDWSWRAHVRTPGKALQIEQDALVELVGDRMTLLQGMFSATFQATEPAGHERVSR